MFMLCTCKVGPGKFEGETALTALLYSAMLNGGSDLNIGATDFFKAPLNLGDDSANVDFAREIGFCNVCIYRALEETECFGAVVEEDSNGFVSAAVLSDEAAWDQMIRRYTEKEMHDG
jgi:hypothetical protein